MFLCRHKRREQDARNPPFPPAVCMDLYRASPDVCKQLHAAFTPSSLCSVEKDWPALLLSHKWVANGKCERFAVLL